MKRASTASLALLLGGCAASADRTGAVPTSRLTLEPAATASPTPPAAPVEPAVQAPAQGAARSEPPAPASSEHPGRLLMPDDEGPPRDMADADAETLVAGDGPVKGGTMSGASRPASPPSARPKSDGWQCPFPPESDKAAIDSAAVLIRVTVSPTGTPEAVTVLNDPGHGFGREASKCAMKQAYVPARDAQNRSIRGDTSPFLVRFVR